MPISTIGSDSLDPVLGIGTTTPSANAKVTIAHDNNQLYFRDTRNANGATGLITYNQNGNFYYDANTTNTITPGGHVWRTRNNDIASLNSAGAFSVPAGSLEAKTITHSTTNASAGSGSPTTTKITRVGDNRWEYSFYFFAGTGGYPSCPNSYWVVCPIQKQDTGTLAFAEVKIWGVHRGMWGTSYSEFARYEVGSGGDGGGVIHELSYTMGNTRLGLMNSNGVFSEQAGLGSGVNLGQYDGNTIGNNYYKMPIFFKIYTNCGADKEYYFQITTTNPAALGPPFKGPMWLNPNTVPTSAIYW